MRLYEQIEAGELDVSTAVRTMRRLTGMTQEEYARRVAGVSVNTLKAIEQGRANPRVSTLDRVGEPSGSRWASDGRGETGDDGPGVTPRAAYGSLQQRKPSADGVQPGM